MTTYQFWKAVAPFSAVLAENILRQTNSLTAARGNRMDPEFTAETGLRHQQEAADLTRLFKERFSDAVPESGIPATPATDTNAPPDEGLSPETRKNILTLTDETIKLQESASGLLSGSNPAAAIPGQQEAYRLLKEIEKLLPRQKQQDKQKQEQEQQQEGQEQESQSKEGDQNQSESQSSSTNAPPPSPTNTIESATNQTVTAIPPKEETNGIGQVSNTLSNDLRQILDRMLMREREHEAEKRRRQERIPMSPSTRDW
jgi:hypothetical protein